MKRHIRIVLILSIMIVYGLAIFYHTSQAKAKKTYVVSTKTKPCNKLYQKKDVYNKYTRHYYLLRSYLEKLKKKGGGTLILEKGTYNICATLFVPSNVTIKLKSNVTVSKTIKTGTKKCKSTKYLFHFRKSKNSSIIGEKKSSINMKKTKRAIAISMTHNKGIHIQNINFKNRYGGSYIAIMGAKNVNIFNCNFKKGIHLKTESDYFDIRMEVANKKIDTFEFPNCKLNNATNQNITIKNNYFSGMTGAIGTTKYAYKRVGKKKIKKIIYQNNINILENRFNNIEGTVIKGMVWENANISFNRFYRTLTKKKTPIGIHLFGVANPTINNNSFQYFKTPIAFNLAVNNGKGKEFKFVKNKILQPQILLLEKNVVKNVSIYYVPYHDVIKKRLTYFTNTEDKYFTIYPTSRPYHGMYEDANTYTENTKQYYLFRSIMEQLEKTGGGTLVVRKGVYNISNAIQIPSNVTIVFDDGVIINKVEAEYYLTTRKAIFVLAAPSVANKMGVVKGYNGTHDVSFISKGRTKFDCRYENPGMAIVLGHNRNIRIQGIDFKRLFGLHFIELNSSMNVVIEDCTFTDFEPLTDELTGDEKTSKEAIGIDGTDINTAGFNYDWSSHDQTTCDNITVRNCEFRNVGTAIGSHTYSVIGQNQLYHKNIKIYNNTIIGTLNSGIRALNWKDFEITKNRFVDNAFDKETGAYGSVFYAVYLRGAINPTVKNNTFVNCNHAIGVRKRTLSQPSSTKYADTISSLSIKNWNDMLDNNLIDCGNDYVKVIDDFLESELPEDYENIPYRSISHPNR